MTPLIVIECGAADTRAALIAGENTLRFWFGPARGDEALARRPETGDVFLGRIRTISKPLGGAFVDLGEGPEGFLSFGAARAPFTEGAAAIVRVRRPALGAKGPVLTLDWKKGLGGDIAARLETEAAGKSAPARLSASLDAALQAVSGLARNSLAALRSSPLSPTSEASREGGNPERSQNWVPAFAGIFGKGVELATNNAEAANILRAALPDISISMGEDLFESSGAESALEAALDRIVSLPGGARLIIDETEAMTVVDIDSGSMAEGAGGRLNDKVNAAAAKALFPELARRGIGGRVVVDFLPPSDGEARKRLVEALTQASRGAYPCRFGRLSVDGLFDLTAPREHLTLLERASEPAGEGLLRRGRRLTLDWRAKEAMRALERGLRARPAVRLALSAGRALIAHIAARPQWAERLAARFGARFSVTPDDKLEERGFELAEER